MSDISVNFLYWTNVKADSLVSITWQCTPQSSNKSILGRAVTHSYMNIHKRAHWCIADLKILLRARTGGLLLSPPVHFARWAHMRHFLSVCLAGLDQNSDWTIIHISESIAVRTISESIAATTLILLYNVKIERLLQLFFFELVSRPLP